METHSVDKLLAGIFSRFEDGADALQLLEADVARQRGGELAEFLVFKWKLGPNL